MAAKLCGGKVNELHKQNLGLHHDQNHAFRAQTKGVLCSLAE